MMMKLLHLRIVFLVLMLAGSAAAWALPVDEVTWIELRTERFRVFSSASVDRTRDIVAALEQFRTVLDQLLPGPPIEESAPTTVFVFGSTASYAPYNLRTASGEPTVASGFCIQSDYGYTIAIDATPGLSFRQLIFHEYVHYLLFRRFPGLPIWVHEGLAEYFSTLSVEDGKARVGFAPQNHVDWLREHAPPPVYQLLGATAESVKYSEIERAGPFYAGSWLLAHYLLQDETAGPLSPEALLALRTADTPFDRALTERLEVSKRELDERLQAYGKKKSFAFTSVPLSVSATPGPGDAEPARREDLLTGLGELLAFVHEDYTAAADHFRVALAVDSTQARAASDLGYALALSGETQPAGEWFDRAATWDADDASIYLKRADATLVVYQRSHPGKALLGDRLDPQLAQARQWAQRATELDPRLAHAFFLLGTTYIFDPGEVGPGIVALEQAHRLDPGRVETTAHLAVLVAREGRFERADRLLAEVRNTSLDAALVRRSREIVDLAKHGYVSKLGQEGRFREAIMLLDEMIEQASDPRYKEVLRDEVRRLSQYDRYRNAVALANGGQLEGARKLLVELQAEGLDPQLADYVSEALEKLGAGPSNGREPGGTPSKTRGGSG
jgi:tetratricopeptide (TPR) repeat protein